ncbi:MAG: transglycosylase SLT domain-containing protein, partial [Candidatus Marinimicrobia bacterium]|nr:transglycosylase SLT domain-containing protein [Candidatus Neomarinimicrobiota bacterium]
QLVPRTGARDAYNYLYNRDRFLSSRYLFNPQNNIELGCAYISKLRYVYFKNVNNDDNALYCVISSYNGGVGTVAKTLCGNTNLKSVTRIINTHDPEWTYSTLENRLPAKETRNYLRRVTKRQRMYASWL